MKLVINKEDINQLKEKYGASNAVAGYVEQWKIVSIPLPKYYVAIIDETNLTLVQLDMKFKEKATTVVPLDSIESIKISGFIVKKIVVKTTTDKIKIVIRPLSFGIGDEQKNLIQRFYEME